jgi:FkbM family methyltransferase
MERVMDRVHAIMRRVVAPGLRLALRHLIYCCKQRVVILRSLGVSRGVRFVVLPPLAELVNFFLGSTEGGEYELRSPDATHPVAIRAGTSDIDVFRQIFVEREYLFLDDVREIRTVVDCGANIGCSSAWFLSRHPDARVVAVEPDPDNFRQLATNLRPYGDRASLVEGAVWSERTGLVVVRGAFRDGRHWAIQVRPSGSGEACDLVAFDMPSLFALLGDGAIDLLKVDIEGSELQLFSDPDAGWMARVRNAAIEIHGAPEDRVVSAAFPPEVFQRSRSGELTAFRRRQANADDGQLPL